MKTQRTASIAGGAIAMLILILDSKTALQGGSLGVKLCIQTVIPSLFPFMVISVFLTGASTGKAVSWFAPLGKSLGIPRGAESLFLTGILGGYPIGAKCVAGAYQSRLLDKHSAERMLAFCSNAGPAFLFGIGAGIFSNPGYCWLVWGIHILSACIVGWAMPRCIQSPAAVTPSQPASVLEAMNTALSAMISICGWIILMGTVQAFLQRWFLWLLPRQGQLLVAGLLELTSGCCGLMESGNLGFRLTMMAFFLGFGGVCVTLQTFGVLQGSGLNGRLYFPGKGIQSVISLLLSAAAQWLLPPEERFFLHPILLSAGCALVICLFLYVKSKNLSSIPCPSGV